MCRLVPALIAFFLLAPSANAAWVWPVDGEVITPYRNGTDPYATGQHRGIDIAAPAGTPVVAAAGGEVRFAGVAGSSGLTISIRTGDGYDTSYLHLSSLAVRANTHVSAGDRLGAAGTTGVRSATTPHLHFGVRDAGTRHDYRDPLSFLPPPAPRAPAPEPPPAAPAPAAEPVPPAASPVVAPHVAPVPSPRRVRVRVPMRRPASRPAPGQESVRAPRVIPGEGRTAEPVRAPLAGAALDERATHRAPTGRESRPDRLPIEKARRAGARASLPGSANEVPLPVLGRPSARTRRHESPGGPDIGWAAACAGLLLGAAILGLTADRRRPRARAKARLTTALRLRLGGR